LSVGATLFGFGVDDPAARSSRPNVNRAKKGCLKQ
jgi:hypothetical protein